MVTVMESKCKTGESRELPVSGIISMKRQEDFRKGERDRCSLEFF